MENLIFPENNFHVKKFRKLKNLVVEIITENNYKINKMLTKINRKAPAFIANASSIRLQS